jgi:hypothetical protein
MPHGAQTSGRAIGRLQEAGLKRLSQPVNSLHFSVADLGAKLIRIMQRIFDYPEDFPKMDVPYGQLPTTQEHYVQNFRAADYKDLRFYVTVEMNSMLPVDKLRVREDALALHGKGVIDDEALVKALEFPDGARVVERMRQNLQKAGIAKQQPGGTVPPVQ